jgi:hypothetical protein
MSAVLDKPGRVRIVVDEDQAQDQRGLIWGLRSRHYSSDSTARLAYEAEALQPLDTARGTALSGASGGTVVTHGTISTNWTPVLGSNIGGTAYLTHTGTYRLWGRVYSTSGTTVQSRAVWDVGDLVNPAENASFRLPGASNFYVKDYGEVRLDPSPVGTHRWAFQIQSKGDAGGENFSIDRIWLQPTDEGAGILTAPIPTQQGVATYSARDEFNQTAGTLGGKTAAVGGSWTTSGATTDLSVESTGHTVQRSTTSDSDWRTATLGVSVTNVAVQLDFKWSAISSSMELELGHNGFTDLVDIGQGSFSLAGVSFEPGAWYTVRVMFIGTTRVAWLAPQGAELGRPFSVSAITAPSSGNVGFREQNPTAAVITRNYDNFAAWVPSPDAVIFASQSAQLTTQGNVRLDSGGTAYGPVSTQVGDLPRIPPAGLEGRTTEVFLKASRGDLDTLPDSGIDDISAQVYFRPSWLFVP